MRVLRWLWSRVWLRGFGPGLVVVVYGLYSSALWFLWQLPGAQPARGVIGRGVVAVAWGPPVASSTGWILGVMTDRTGTSPRPGVYGHLLVPTRGRGGVVTPALYWDVVLRKGFVKIPLVYIGLVMMVPPLIAEVRRRRRRLPGTCVKCGYSLTGLAGGACPECGSPVE